MGKLKVDGKFFKLAGKRIWLKCVTYGPFPAPLPNHSQELRKIKAAGFNSVRLYTPPSDSLLDAAQEHDLLLFVGVPWEWNRVFLGDGCESYWHQGRIKFLNELAKWGDHPQVVAVYIANEISPDIARWQGYEKTRKSLDELICDLRHVYPELLYAYSNYPSSEYLEPEQADFTALNVYLEHPNKLKNYLEHLHHISGDRPVMISEFGLDSDRNGEEKQANSIKMQLDLMRSSGTAGATLFSWSDNWINGSLIVDDWSFGLTRRDGSNKPSLSSIRCNDRLPTLSRYPMISIIICVHNGAERVKPALDYCDKLNYPCYELLVIDDGSKDHLKELCQQYPYLQYVRQNHSGLSAARNLGAKMAKGDIFAYTDDDCVPDQDWLYWIARAYIEQDCHLCGGPNLPPEPSDEDEAVIASAPGSPSHVMFSNTQAEHIPGCNLTVSRGAYELIGGFRERYWIAGDDVDFCWRAEKLNLKIGFHGAAFVWHRRRATFYNYIKQQKNYGKAEALLMEQHPERFNSNGDAEWNGVIYQGGAVVANSSDTIYSGNMGSAPFQSIQGTVMPMRPLHRSYTGHSAQFKLRLAKKYHPLLRKLSRIYYAKIEHKWDNTFKALAAHFYKIEKTESPTVREKTISCNCYEDKQKFITHKLSGGWKILKNDPHWDLKKGENRLLITIENLGGGAWQMKIRSRYTIS